MARSNRPVYRAWLVALTLLAFALRAWRVDFQPLWWDEGLSIYRTGLSWAGIVAESYDNVHPPGYFLLLALWSRFAGPGVVATRLLSVFFDTLSIPLLAAVGARLGGRRIGLAAAALMAVSPFHIYHAQQARMYALVPCLVLVATMLLLRIEAASRRRLDRRSAAYVLTLAAALHVHYFTIFIPAVHTADVLVRRRIPLRRWAAMLAATAALCLPWAVYVGRQVVTSASSKVEAEGFTPLGPLAYLVRYLTTVGAGYNVGPDGFLPGGMPDLAPIAAIAASILAILGLIAWRRNAGDRAWLPALWLAVPVAGGYLVNLRVPFDSFPRLLAFTAPALWLLWAGAVVEALDRRRRWDTVFLALAAALLVSTVSLARHYTVPREPEEDYRPLAAQLMSLAGSNDEERRRDIVIADFPWQAGYLRAYAPAIASRVWLPPGARWAAEEGMMERDLADLVDGAKDESTPAPSRVWYVAYQGMGGTKGRNIEAWLTGNTFLARDAWFGDTRLLLFGGGRQEREADVGAASDWSTLDVPVGDAIRLAAARLAIADVAPGDVLPVELRWEASARPAGRYKVFAHLVDVAGAVVAQHDAEPAFGTRPTSDWAHGDGIDDAFGVQVPWATPAGEYRLVAGMYDPATGERLPTGTPDNRIAVGLVWVHDPDRLR